MRTIVFAFHYIRNDTYSNPGIHPFSIDEFINILTFCKNKGNILTPENFFEKKLDNKKINFLFTFDDGLIDHFNILPLMDEYHVKGIFFICSSYYRDKKLLNVHKIHHARSHIPEKIFKIERTFRNRDTYASFWLQICPDVLNFFKEALNFRVCSPAVKLVKFFKKLFLFLI